MSPVDHQLKLAAGNLLSIGEAAKLTPYSSEYLSLLARKGRLKAIKLNRDWFTTRQAVLAYFKEQQNKHQSTITILEAVEGGMV